MYLLSFRLIAWRFAAYAGIKRCVISKYFCISYPFSSAATRTLFLGGPKFLGWPTVVRILYWCSKTKSHLAKLFYLSTSFLSVSKKKPPSWICPQGMGSFGWALWGVEFLFRGRRPLFVAAALPFRRSVDGVTNCCCMHMRWLQNLSLSWYQDQLLLEMLAGPGEVLFWGWFFFSHHAPLS